MIVQAVFFYLLIHSDKENNPELQKDILPLPNLPLTLEKNLKKKRCDDNLLSKVKEIIIIIKKKKKKTPQTHGESTLP